MAAENIFDKENPYTILIGSVNCMRHKPEMGIGRLMQSGRASLLCPTMTDFATGRYLNQLYDAVIEINELRGAKYFKVVSGCQWEIISTDASFIIKRLKDEHGFDVVISEEGHLERGQD